MKRALAYGIVSALVIGAGHAAAQRPPAPRPPQSAAPPANGDYIRELPTVQRVKTEITGSDPADTLARQMAVLVYLQPYIDRIRVARDYRAEFTPSELQLIKDSYAAATQIQADFKKSHTPAEYDAWYRTEQRYEVMNAREWLTQLAGQGAKDTYRGAERSLAQSYIRHEENLQRQFLEAQNGPNRGIAGDPVLDPLGIFAKGEADRVKDPQLRRCLELGSSLQVCEGANMLEGFGTLLFGGFLEPAKKDARQQASEVAGVVYAGAFDGPKGQASLVLENGFTGGGGVIVGCGALVDTVYDQHPYTLHRGPAGQVQLVMANGSAGPITLTVQPGGGLTGPGLVAVQGRVIQGYNTTTETVMYNGAPAGPQGIDCGGPCTKTSSVPNYVTKVERCTIGALTPVKPKPIEQPKIGIPMLDAMNKSEPLVPGLRMVGRYVGQGGLTLEFENGSVIIDCKRAHIRAGYQVDNTAEGFVVRVQNASGAFALAMAPDNSLRGQGQTMINGRLVTAIQGDNVRFQPVSDTCPVGILAPNAKRNTMVAQR
jgi:hypothetical protein